uniref:Uncharacterized protein n=1 Tax=Tanacetum cinerariifolium TaxID=118510 RepID=A0A6L2KQI0_TANCI|nr:hypothetical protein [Tanacetum cinerariifolium]
MASLDYRLNPIYTIKERSSYGALYNKSCGCSKGDFVDKFVRNPNKTPDSSQRPPHNCLKCGNPVDGLYYRQCALLRKKLKEVWFRICEENEVFQDFLNTYKSSNDNTNVVSAPQEPFVFNQDPGENSLQSPPHIDHHCCYRCGDSLDGIFVKDVLVLLLAWDRVFEIKDAFGNNQYKPEDMQELIRKLFNEVQNIHEELADVEDLVLIPSESEGIPDNMCDVPFHNNSPPLDISKDQFEDFFNFNDDFTSIDDVSFFIDDIDYVEASPPDSELVSLGEVKDFHPEDGEIKDDILHEKLLNIHFLFAKIESLNDNPTHDRVLKYPSPFPIPVKDSDSLFEKSDTSLSYSDNSLPEFKTFSNHTEETSSGGTTTYVDNSLPKYDSFLLEIEPNQGKLTSIVMKDNLGEPRVHIFYFDIEEKNSGSTIIHADFSLLDLECFYFKSEPYPGDLTSIVDFEICENILSTTNVKFSPEEDHSPLFSYVVMDIQEKDKIKAKMDKTKHRMERREKDKEEVAIDDWKIRKEGKKRYYQMMRADGKTQMYMVFSQMLESFDKEDLEELYELKMKYGRSNKEYKVLEWKLYDSCGVHSLRMQSMQVFMLVEKTYPLTPSTLTMMLEKKLQIDYQSEMAYQLLKLGRIVRIKSLLDAVGITAAQVFVNTALMKSKENKYSSTSKDASHHKSSGKSAHAEEPSHTVEDSGMQQDHDKRRQVDFQPPYTWISQVALAEEPPTSIDEFNDTSFDFYAFVMNRLKIPNLAQEILVEDLQLGVESYQKKLNLTKPDTFISNLRNKTAYTSHSDPYGKIYVDQFKRKRLMRSDELHKFNDESCLPLLLNKPNLILNLSPREKGLRLENATEDSILERNRESQHFKLSWMLLLSLRAILHFSPLQMFLRDIFQICPRVNGQNFDELPIDEDIVSFFKELGHTGEIKSIINVVVDQIDKPRRTFSTIINRSLSGKTIGLNKLRLSKAQILWAMYYKKNVDYAELLWEDLTYQIENRGHKKQDKMYYPRFTKVIIHHFPTKDKTVSKRNKIDIHTFRDDYLMNTLRFISTKEESQIYGARLLKFLPEEPTRKSKRVKRPVKNSTNAPSTGVVIRETHVMSLSKKKEKVTVEKRKGIDLISEVDLPKEAQYEEVHNKSLRDFDKTHIIGSSTVTKIAPSGAKIKPSFINKGTGAKPRVLSVTEEESTKSSDQESDSGDENTRSDNEKGSDSKHETDENETGSESNQEDNEEEVEDDEEEKDDEFVKTSTNSTNDEDETNFKDKAEGNEDKGIDYTTNQIDDDVDVRLNEPVNTDEGLIQKKGTDVSALEKEVAELKKDDLLNNQVTALVDEHLDSRIGASRAVLEKESSQPQSTYKAATSLIKFELKKILINKMDESQSYLTATEHRECYAGIIKSHDLDKSLFLTYDKVYSLKRIRKDKDTNEDPFTRSDRGSKKRKTSKDDEPTKGPKAKDSKFGSSKDSEMPQYQEENLGDDDEEPRRKVVSKRDWFTKPKQPQEPIDLDWNVGKTPQQGPTQSWLMTLASSTKKLSKTFDELMSSPIDFSVYIMNGMKITNRTQETLLGPAFKLLKGTRTNFPKLEYNFKECYKALSEKLNWENPKGIEDMVPNIWSPVKVAYDKHVFRVFFIREINVRPSIVALTKEAQYEEVRKKSLREFHKTHPSGSDTITKIAPKWDKDDNNNDRDLRSKGSDHESDSGDDNTQSDKEKRLDSEHETNENETSSKYDQEKNEEEVEDDEEEKDDDHPIIISILHSSTTTININTTTKTKATNPLSTLQNFASIFQFNNIVSALEKEVVKPKKDDLLNPQVTALVDEHLDSRLGATIDEFISYLSASITARITEQAIASLIEFELKKILIDIIDESQSYLTATEDRECYDRLIKSYNLDKILFLTYDKVYSLKRSRKDKDKDEDPSARSDQGLKKRKTSKDDEPKKNRLTKLLRNDVSDFAITLRMFTRCMVIQKRVEDPQIGVKSYQTMINVTKPETTKPASGKGTNKLHIKTIKDSFTILKNQLDRVSQQHLPFSLSEHLKADSTGVNINKSLRVLVWSVWVLFLDFIFGSFWLGYIDLLLVTFDSELKIFNSLLNNQASDTHTHVSSLPRPELPPEYVL